MSSKGFVMLVLFVLSEVAGVALGEWFYHLFLKYSDFRLEDAGSCVF